MLITYLIMKLTLQAIVDECNRLALEEESHAQARVLKARVGQLDVDYMSGVIDEETYNRLGAEILKELEALSKGGVQITRGD